MVVRSLLRWLVRSLLALLSALLLFGSAYYLHYLWSGPELKPWHTARLTAEFTARDYEDGTVTTLDQYRAREQRVLDQVSTDVYQKVAERDRLLLNRYHAGSLGDPGVWETNWNRTFVLEPAGPPVGGALLLHGLTDSPYSLRSVGLALAARGFRVIGLRLPGHGTAPAGLLTFEVEDLEAATELAMRDLRAGLAPGQPLYLLGYSNGAALAVSYALDAREDAALPRPAGLVLISPAIGITRLAALGRIRTGLSDLQGFGRAAWQVIEPEIDPYKYQSFSFHAAGQAQRLTSRLTRRIERLAEAGPLRGMPPILAFVSTVDATVRAGAVVDGLLARLAPGGHELVLFDVNRLAAVAPMLVADPAPLTRRLLEQAHRPYALALITNAGPRTLEAKEHRVPAQGMQATERSIDQSWPTNVFSLSHVALPFPPDDPLYGYAAPRSTRHIQLGSIEVRGENGVLNVPSWMLTRQRSNPFHRYLVDRIVQFVGAPPALAGQRPAAAAAP
ncbi:MAG TPA: alpha/beta fold hydrolase [Steroidobacteraceae bacterium]